MLLKLNYLVMITLMMLGLWAMIAKKILLKIDWNGDIPNWDNLIYISMGAKEGSTIPIIDYYHVYDPIVVSNYANPLTQILMLTAIVVE